MKKYLVIFATIILFIAGGYFYVDRMNKKESSNTQTKQEAQQVSENKPAETQNIQEIPENKQAPETPKENASQKIEQNVPFMVQAPFGNWKDQIFQNGCEEAAMTMAFEWTEGTLTISAEEAQNKIKKLTSFEDESLGYDTDTDIYDMQKIFQKYFNYQDIKTQENIKLDDIKNEIQKGNIVLVPTFGRALSNPNYTAPGPITHMLVIIGYDPDTKKFITNDSGTKRGKDYQYPENVLFDAIWEYPSGPKLPDLPKGALKKGMLVIEAK
jgi:hypothetical protein